MAKSEKQKKADNKIKHDKLKKSDKIYNNKYNTGAGAKDSDEFQLNTGIKVDQGFADLYHRDIYEYEQHVDCKILLDQILGMIEEDSELHKLLKDSNNISKKFNGNHINFMFDKIFKLIQSNPTDSKFTNSIYIVEVISSITGFEYKKIFDFLEYEYRIILINELNVKYNFLETGMKSKKMF